MKKMILTLIFLMGISESLIANDIEKAIQACENGHIDSCSGLGITYSLGLREIKKDDFKAAKFFTKACDGGDAMSCIELGDKYIKGVGVRYSEKKADSLYDKGIDLYITKCDDGKESACRILGNIYYEGKIVHQDYTKASDFYSKACEKGSRTGCSKLANMYTKGEGVQKDELMAFKLFAQSCNAGSGTGCFHLGWIYAKGKIVKQDNSKAEELFRKSCNKGEARGCSIIGVMYAKGKGVPQNDYKALELLTKACDGNVGMGCFVLGELHEEGRAGLRKNAAKEKKYFIMGISNSKNIELILKRKAAKFYAKACKYNILKGCFNVGMALKNNIISFDPLDNSKKIFSESAKNKSFYYFNHACDGGFAEGCLELGYIDIHSYGIYANEGKKRYVKRAIINFNKACEKGSASGCYQLGEIYNLGNFYSINKDDKKAMRLFGKACDGGHSGGCEDYARLKKRGVTTEPSFFQKLKWW